MQFSCNYSQMSNADFCQVTVAMGMWPLSYYFTQVETATEKVNLRCGLLSNYSCDDIRPFVQLHWIGIVLK